MNPAFRELEQPRHKKPNYKVRYCVRRQFVGNGSYGDYPGDAGLIIPKLLGFPNDETLIRIGLIEEYRAKEQYECGQCGNKFTRMELRDRHFQKRHQPRRFAIRNLEDMNEDERQNLKQSIIAEDDKSPAYQTTPTDFRVPDPEDAEFLADEKFAEETAPIRWDKTKASRK